MAVNLDGPFLCVRRALPAMRDRGYGRIVAIGSASGILVVNEAWTPQWKASVDGVEADVFRANYTLRAIVGESHVMESLRQMVAKVASSPASTVLLTGESGTGKDLVAKTIHYSSTRASRPFMNITCSALPEQLLESELFGHERGAFTDARVQKRGLLESADGGTVFLDEIGEMVPALQAKLLRVLEEKSFKRVGGAADIRVYGGYCRENKSYGFYYNNGTSPGACIQQVGFAALATLMLVVIYNDVITNVLRLRNG